MSCVLLCGALFCAQEQLNLLVEQLERVPLDVHEYSREAYLQTFTGTSCLYNTILDVECAQCVCARVMN